MRTYVPEGIVSLEATYGCNFNNGIQVSDLPSIALGSIIFAFPYKDWKLCISLMLILRGDIPSSCSGTPPISCIRRKYIARYIHDQ